MPLRTLDLLQLGRLAFERVYGLNPESMLQDRPDFARLRAWALKHGESPDSAIEAVLLVTGTRIPGFLRGLPPSPGHASCLLAFTLGSVISLLGSNWSDRLLRPMLWFAVVRVLVSLDRPMLNGSGPLIRDSTRRSLLDGCRSGGGCSGRDARSESPRKCLGRALDALAMWEWLGPSAWLLAPCHAARAWALPSQARERFRSALALLTEPLRASRFEELRRRALAEPSPEPAGSPEPERILEPTPAGPVEPAPSRRSQDHPSLLPIPTLSELREDLRWLEARIARAGLTLMVTLLPLPGRPILSEARATPQGENLEGCARCPRLKRHVTLRNLLLAWDWFRATASVLPMQLRDFVLSTHPSDLRLGRT